MSAAKIWRPLLAVVLSIALRVSGQQSPAVNSHSISVSNTVPPTVGMEGRIDVVLPEAGLSARSPDRRAPLLLRIAYTRPHGSLTFYDLRYVGRVPGRFDLRDYLVATNGLVATNLPALTVSVSGVLPAQHNGWLEEQALRTPSFFGGYRALLLILGAFWVVAFFAILRWGRKPGIAGTAVPVKPAPSFAEKIRPLVERAAAGTLSGDEKATLERMLITHWQRRLNLRDADGGELIARLRQHREAGDLLRALEDWLHRPAGAAQVNVESVLAPYRHLPAGEVMEAGR